MENPPISPTSPTGRGFLPAEVETEVEEEEEEQAAEQVDDEDLEEEASYDPPSSDGGAARGGQRSQDYSVPEASKEVWKNFGCNTEAGRLLRRLYNTKGPSEAASKVSYPRLESPSSRWEPKAGPRKPCPQRAPVRVPRPTRASKYDPDDPRNWRVPLPGRKPESEIRAEMEAERPEIPDIPRGRDQAAEKAGLQDKFQFCGGRAMPKGAMGHVENAALPTALPKNNRRELDDNGMNAEHREIFEELMLAIKRKQERIKEIDAQDALDSKPSKEKTEKNKEALQLRNDIDRCLKDIDKLMELTA
mmetsp:Transcript_22359/g.47728  ORF Transcript_22359/g.47728 Transcript_22359/m.47728 type:complete len:304 (+) Transcript_22359:66-977(+)